MLQPLLGTPEGIHRGCMIIKKQVFATNRDPWATYLQVSVAKEGKVLEQKKLLQPLLGTPEGTEMGCIIFFLQVRLCRSTLMNNLAGHDDDDWG